MTRATRHADKVAWSGVIRSVQPWIELDRSFDIRQHNYRGYELRLVGECGQRAGEFVVRVGSATHAKHAFVAGASASGNSVPVYPLDRGTPLLYRTSHVCILSTPGEAPAAVPPFHGVPPSLETYRARGHLRLDEETYWQKCSQCMWACLMHVTMTIDHWNPSYKEYRWETFCYGPKGCVLYQAGDRRVVPGRNGMEWEEPDWVDEEKTALRGPGE